MDLVHEEIRDISRGWEPHEFYVVEGFGRVGSYAKAKAGHYSRSRHHWCICKFDPGCSQNCRFKSRDGYDAHYPRGGVPDPSFPPFKTKTAAGDHLVKWANANLPGGPFILSRRDRLEKAPGACP